MTFFSRCRNQWFMSVQCFACNTVTHIRILNRDSNISVFHCVSQSSDSRSRPQGSLQFTKAFSEIACASQVWELRQHLNVSIIDLGSAGYELSLFTCFKTRQETYAWPSKRKQAFFARTRIKNLFITSQLLCRILSFILIFYRFNNCFI